MGAGYILSCNKILFCKMCFCNQVQTNKKGYLYLGMKKDKTGMFHCAEDSNRCHKDCSFKSL